MKVAISGASGFVGAHLTAYLQQRGHDVAPLGRADFTDQGRVKLMQLITTCDAVVNLAGAPIDHRWSDAYKEELYSSRLDTTRRLVEAVNAGGRTQTFVSTSAVGYYPSVGCYDEYDAEQGTGFLANLCVRWEEEARKVRTRCVITRFGVVLSADGGALRRLVGPARAGVAVVAGSGHQPFSWIGLDDLLRAEEFLLTRADLSGVFNLTAPEKLTMREFMRAVAKRYHTLLTLPVPAFLLRVSMGESADFLLKGQCVMPHRLAEEGFGFEAPSIEEFLRRI